MRSGHLSGSADSGRRRASHFNWLDLIRFLAAQGVVLEVWHSRPGCAEWFDGVITGEGACATHGAGGRA